MAGQDFVTTLTSYIPIRRERESGQESCLLPQLKRIHRQFCQFEQKNDYEPEKTVKLIREAKKVNEGTLSSV